MVGARSPDARVGAPLREDEVEEWWSAVAAAEEAERAAAEAAAATATTTSSEDAAAAAAEGSPTGEVPEAAGSSGAAFFDDYAGPWSEPYTWRELLADPQNWGPALQALYERKAAQAAVLCSDRRVTLRARDLTVIALEGAAAGAVFAAGFVLLFLRR